VKVFKYSLIIGFAGLSYFLYTNIDILILEQFGYTVEIGYYKIIFNVFNIIILPFTLLGQVMSPYITEIGAKKDFKKLNAYLKYLWLILILALLITLVCFLGGPIFFSIVFPAYANAVLLSIWNIMLILIPFKLYGAVLTHGLLYPLGLGNITMYLTLGGGILKIISDYILIILIGFRGVFYGTIAIHSLTIIFTLIIFYIKIKNKKIKV
jgi:O-antigen/teichoic acid export membrane protein